MALLTWHMQTRQPRKDGAAGCRGWIKALKLELAALCRPFCEQPYLLQQIIITGTRPPNGAKGCPDRIPDSDTATSPRDVC